MRSASSWPPLPWSSRSSDWVRRSRRHTVPMFPDDGLARSVALPESRRSDVIKSACSQADIAKTPGEMAGARLVREWNPATGAQRTWYETLDHNGAIRIVRPETGGSKVHYTFDAHGNYTGSR